MGRLTGSGLRADCVGNLMRLSWDGALATGNQIEVEAINGTKRITISPKLAAQCGYSMESDPWGNTRIYTSLTGCFVDNKEDKTFSIGLRLQMYTKSPSDGVSHDVAQTCSYSDWATREILCERNYMEESNASHSIWKVTFFTPEPVAKSLHEAEQAGYSATTTPTRLVMRIPGNTAETYTEDVARISMEVLKVAVYYKSQKGLSVMNLAAACPVGGVVFTNDVISWYIPRRLTPILDGRFKIVEKHMGINGQRLDKSQMSTKGYKLFTTDVHIVMEIPVGSPDGYYKSHTPDYQYYVTYSVEPMLEVLWRADDTLEDIRYKVLFPITTPVILQTISTRDETVPEERMFSIFVGTFLNDVVLRNLTFPTGVFAVEEGAARGFHVQEQVFSNGTKDFFLQVDFDSDLVPKSNPEPLVTNYFLSLILGFVVLPEEAPFGHVVEVETSVQDVVLPTLTGTCDQKKFYISITHGSQGHNFKIMVGPRHMTSEMAEDYEFKENGTHCTLVVPYDTPDAVFEMIMSTSIRARLDVTLWEPNGLWMLNDLYLACSFPLTTTKCYPNGTITALAVKLESVSSLVLSSLTLKDPSCKPVFSNDHFAYFSFSADSCGTTRMFSDNYMQYENEISLHYNRVAHTKSGPVYRQTVFCYYMINETASLSFQHKPRDSDPKADIGIGHLEVQMRLALDEFYEDFYQPEDYPVEKYLKQLLYFEVALMHSDDTNLELMLENCWATLHESRTSLPSWAIILNGCENKEDHYLTTFLPVERNARGIVPSHIKRFSINMFTFIKDDEVLKDEIYVHCDVTICDKNGKLDGACGAQCTDSAGKSVSTKPSHQKQISSGQIVLSNRLQ
ncbi:uncharacterized protein KZ484_013134 [Pholidichthys leucotaenia]